MSDSEAARGCSAGMEPASEQTRDVQPACPQCGETHAFEMIDFAKVESWLCYACGYHKLRIVEE